MLADPVVVFLYTYWDEESKSHKTSTRYATADAIKNGLGLPVHSTERKVDRSELVDGEFYDRNPQDFRSTTPQEPA